MSHRGRVNPSHLCYAWPLLRLHHHSDQEPKQGDLRSASRWSCTHVHFHQPPEAKIRWSKYFKMGSSHRHHLYRHRAKMMKIKWKDSTCSVKDSKMIHSGISSKIHSQNKEVHPRINRRKKMFPLWYSVHPAPQKKDPLLKSHLKQCTAATVNFKMLQRLVAWTEEKAERPHERQKKNTRKTV